MPHLGQRLATITGDRGSRGASSGSGARHGPDAVNGTVEPREWWCDEPPIIKHDHEGHDAETSTSSSPRIRLTTRGHLSQCGGRRCSGRRPVKRSLSVLQDAGSSLAQLG